MNILRHVMPTPRLVSAYLNELVLQGVPIKTSNFHSLLPVFNFNMVKLVRRLFAAVLNEEF